MKKELIKTENNESFQPKYLKLSHFSLLIIAMIAMTINHVGTFFFHDDLSIVRTLYTIGRIAFPLYAFISVQGVYKSSNNLEYSLRLIVLGLLIDLVMFFSNHGYNGNAMFELGLGVLALSLFKRNDGFSLLGLIPAAVMVLSDFEYFPIRAEYGTYGLAIMLGFYFGEKFGSYYIDYYASLTKIDKDYLIKSSLRKYQNIFSIVIFIILSILFSVLSLLYPNAFFINKLLGFQIQDYAIIASVFIFFYSGKQGIHNAFTQGFFYLYYPLHIVLLYYLSLWLL
ncbi:MAG: TraX family protein [Bacilli bacterium]|nr:TraX family protein [Bacilli bacterium]